MEKHMILKGGMRNFILVSCALWGAFSVKAQTVVNGDFADFGIHNVDTVLSLDRTTLMTSNRTSIFYADYRKSFEVSLSLKCHTWGTEQVFLCKEGGKREMFADLSIGYDPMQKRVFAEVKDRNGELHRVVAGPEVKMDTWYDVKVCADYDERHGESSLSLSVASPQKQAMVSKVRYKGTALLCNATPWVIGRGFPGGFPNSLQVLKGEIAHVRISGSGLARKSGENPLFTDCFTADPACLVDGDRIYAYVGEDKASPGGWFSMPHWLCYSSTDMVNWESHGVVLKAGSFPNANPGGAWAGQVVKKGDKYYYYVTLDNKSNGAHMIDVAVSDSPYGPFHPARKDGTPLITDDMTPDSHRPNADIDPTVFIDDDGIPWMAWGNGDCYMVRLKQNMIELDGEVRKVPMRNFSEGPWLFKRNGLYYNVYAADAPGVQPEQIAYSTARNIEGPWTYRGLLTGPAKYGFTIHPSVNEFHGEWYFFYHDGSYSLYGEPGGDCRRRVCVEHLYFNPDGTIQPITLTREGISVPRKK